MIWTPGAAGPLDELVARLQRIVERFQEEHGLASAEVEVELFDGSRHHLASMRPEPGFGFLTLVPVDEEGSSPRLLIVPVGALRTFEISAPDPERLFGFAADLSG
jgi:hypothetical protein